MLFTKEELVHQLKQSVCEVVFVKVDGTERVMKCTLLDAIVQPYIEAIKERNKKLLEEGKEINKTVEKPNVLPVIDVENNGWRSFKLDSIKSIKQIDYKF